jgi:drug/metabolite transporter (DMT)-like permease
MSFSQIFFKLAANYQNELNTKNILSNYFLNPWLYGAAIFLVTATIIWIKLLTILPLSKIYPYQSAAYLITAVMALIFFGEKIGVINLFGYILIITGVYLSVINK